jgi:hypothetical protein
VAWLDTVSPGIANIAQSQVTNLVTDLAARTLTSTFRDWAGQSSTSFETIDRFAASVSYTAGNIWLTFFTPMANLTVSEMTMASTASASSGLTLARFGLYTFDGTTATLVARTASDTTLFNSPNTRYTRSFDTTGGYPATYALQAGQRYAAAYIATGTTMANAFGKTSSTVLTPVAPRASAVVTGQTDLLASITSFANLSVAHWMRLS